MSLEIEDGAPAPERQSVMANGSLFNSALVDRRAIWSSDELVTLGRCIYCRETSSREVTRRRDGLVIHECLSCGLAYVDPRPGPAQLARYYGEGYFRGEKDFFHGKDYCEERDKSIHAKAVTGYREIVSHFDLEGKSVLDIGCASGALLFLLRERGARELVGIDSAAYPINYGIENYKLDLRCNSLEEANLPAAHFDLITLIDVIEHFEDLHSVIAELRRVLKPGGHLFVITPNYLAYSLAKRAWTCLYKDFEHLQYFSEQSLREICRSAGIRMLKSWSDSIPFRIFEYPRVYKSGLHRFLHPEIVVRNALAEMKFNRAAASPSLLGGNLCAILRNG